MFYFPAEEEKEEPGRMGGREREGEITHSYFINTD